MDILRQGPEGISGTIRMLVDDENFDGLLKHNKAYVQDSNVDWFKVPGMNSTVYVYRSSVHTVYEP